MTRHVLAVDQGTTNTKALLVDATGVVVARGARPVATFFPQPGWVEQDAETIWKSVQGAIADCLAAAPGVTPAAIGISNQRESFVMWDRGSGKPLGPCITWQCRRTTPICDAIKAQGAEDWVQAKTGLAIDPLFSASKARWLLDSIPNGQARARDGEICLGSVDSWLIWKLTGAAVHATDTSNASRTQLLDLTSATWDESLLALYDIPRQALATIVPSSGIVGETAKAAGLPPGIPIAGIAGDSHAAMFGHSGFDEGAVKATYGTGTSLMTLAASANAAPHGLSRTVAWRLGGVTTLALEGNIASTGGTMDWFGRSLGGDAATASALANEVSDAGGVYLVPAFAGLGAPHWDDTARGLISGMTHGTLARHVARAALESIAYQVMDVMDAMERARGVLGALMADGGASRNDALMQFQADMIARPVLRNRCADLSAIGAARLAGLAIGIWRFADLRSLPQAIDRFEPRMPEADRRARSEGWQEAVSRAKLAPSDIEGRA